MAEQSLKNRYKEEMSTPTCTYEYPRPLSYSSNTNKTSHSINTGMQLHKHVYLFNLYWFSLCSICPTSVVLITSQGRVFQIIRVQMIGTHHLFNPVPVHEPVRIT